MNSKRKHDFLSKNELTQLKLFENDDDYDYEEDEEKNLNFNQLKTKKKMKIGIKEGQTSANILGNEDEWMKKLKKLFEDNNLPLSDPKYAPREDGMYWKLNPEKESGNRYDRSWLKEEELRRKIMESDPNFLFVNKVAGLTNATVEDIIDNEHVSEKARIAYFEQEQRRQMQFSNLTREEITEYINLVESEDGLKKKIEQSLDSLTSEKRKLIETYENTRDILMAVKERNFEQIKHNLFLEWKQINVMGDKEKRKIIGLSISVLKNEYFRQDNLYNKDKYPDLDYEVQYNEKMLMNDEKYCILDKIYYLIKSYDPLESDTTKQFIKTYFDLIYQYTLFLYCSELINVEYNETFEKTMELLKDICKDNDRSLFEIKSESKTSEIPENMIIEEKKKNEETIKLIKNLSDTIKTDFQKIKFDFENSMDDKNKLPDQLKGTDVFGQLENAIKSLLLKLNEIKFINIDTNATIADLKKIFLEINGIANQNQLLDSMSIKTPILNKYRTDFYTKTRSSLLEKYRNKLKLSSDQPEDATSDALFLYIIYLETKILAKSAEKKELDEILESLREKEKNVLTGLIKIKEAPELPYQHRYNWATKSQNTGVLKFKPIFTSGISVAFNKLKSYVKWTQIKEIDSESFQFSEDVVADFAELVAVNMSFSFYRAPNQYLPVTLKTQAIRDQVNIIQRIRDNYKPMRVPLTDEIGREVKDEFGNVIYAYRVFRKYEQNFSKLSSFQLSNIINKSIEEGVAAFKKSRK